jgi:transcriptional repressor NrdR
VAYLRFASVYRAFTSIEDFEAEIRALRTQTDDLTDQPHQATHEDAPRDLEPAR